MALLWRPFLFISVQRRTFTHVGFEEEDGSKSLLRLSKIFIMVKFGDEGGYKRDLLVPRASPTRLPNGQGHGSRSKRGFSADRGEIINQEYTA